MPLHKRKTAILAVLAAALAVGCTSNASAPTPTPSAAAPSAAASSAAPAPGAHASGAPSSADPAPRTLAQYYSQRLAWRPCDKYFECARLLVPFDYARPAWRRFSLPVVRLPAAEPGGRIGALVINPGGPGGSGIAYALSARSGEFTSGILGRLDIVG